MFSFLPSLLWSNVSNKAPEDAMADYIMHQDKKALESLYNNFADDLYHYLVTLSDASLAKDIAQKTWLKVIEKPHNYHRAGSVKAWLFTIARNTLFDEYKKTNRWVEFSEQDDEHALSYTSQADIDDLRTAFDQALMALPLEQRETFCLQQEGFSLSEIADITAVPQETIKTRLRYAKTKLKALLEKYHE